MPARSRLMLPGGLALGLALSGCAIFGPIFGFPPIGEAELVIENATEERWVVRVVADAFPQDFAVPSGTTGMALLFAGAPQTIVLLDTDCQQIDELEWTDTSMA
ncbi:MAG TPA: hypothetical protein VEW95_00710, partial [Candidatus Limnocylindrales bacterium]|nr:hypothetical protein [Candidatus Limnocylindrales bacterium]